MHTTEKLSILRGPAAPAWESRLHSVTVAELLQLRSTSTREVVFLDAQDAPMRMTWGSVARRSFHYAQLLRGRGVERGDRVVLMLPTCPEYLYTFFGIIAAGAIPVPVYPPLNLKRLRQFLDTLVGVFDDCGASTIVFWKDVKPILGEALGRASTVRNAIAIETLEQAPETSIADPAVLTPDDTALLQYTSGSTGAPKGVELTHRNLLHNVQNVEILLDVDSERDCCVSWLPLYHDMGLIGSLLGSLYTDIRLVLMAPQTFLMRPRLWLQAITEYGGTISVAPNFAFSLCAMRISDKALAGIDLSSLRTVLCGAEPIRYDTYQAFLERFGPYGFRENVFLPVYGLAESTVGSTIPTIHRRPTVLWLDREALEIHHHADVVPPDTPQAVAAFGLGRPFTESAARIVDPETGAALAEGQVGEIRLRGPSVMKGYYRNPQATAEVLSGGWLRTGDLGFIRDGHLFVTGRSKDVIIRNGRNYYPQDIEGVVEADPEVRTGCVIAFGYVSEQTQTEQICVLAETRVTEAEALDTLRARLREELGSELGLVPDRIELVPPHTLLKTSSGKLRRKPTRDSYLTGELVAHDDSLLDQVKLLTSSKLHWARRRIDDLRGRGA
ncbi:MAG: fatty acyl-AMP ligase [Longimicrobiaceae bacterium]